MRWREQAVAAALLVIGSRYAFHSDYLFSWDSANFALALDNVDIAAHQPHPPGYLGYVWVARAIRLAANDANLSLVLWNIIATALAVLLLMRFARELAPEQADHTRIATIAGLIFASGPLLWFYGTVAEIYPSELLATLLIAYTAWRAQRGVPGAMLRCAGAVTVALLFKVSAAVLMLPLVLYAWSRVSSTDRRRSALVFLGGTVAVGAIFLTVQPDLPAVVWNQLVSSTSETRLIDGDARPLRQLNRNLRDVLLALTSALGPVNLLALLVLGVAVRTLPTGLGRPFVWLWLAPWLLTLIGVHIGKPGYVLPMVPVLVIILAMWYARMGRVAQVAVVGLQLATNVAMFVWLSPPSPATSGSTVPYRSKTLLQKLISDTEALTATTAQGVAASDASIAQLETLVRTTCAAGNPVIVAGSAGVDWRRVMWYFPSATALRVSERNVLSVATDRHMATLPAEGLTIATSCPIIWLDGTTAPLPRVTPPAVLRATPSGITVIQNDMRNESPRPF
jgi:hypothetical protein